MGNNIRVFSFWVISVDTYPIFSIFIENAMENAKSREAGIRAEISRIFENDKRSLGRLFSLLGELERASNELLHREASLRRELLRLVLEEQLQNDRELELVVLRLRRECRARYLDEIKRQRDLLWIYALIMYEFKIWEVPTPKLSFSSTINPNLKPG
jgi:hypothetical protein